MSLRKLVDPQKLDLSNTKQLKKQLKLRSVIIFAAPSASKTLWNSCLEKK
jgi:hypothetical protein